MELNRQKAIKKRTIQRTKAASWDNFISSLNTSGQSKKFWNFTKKMMGSPDPLNSADFPLTDARGLPIRCVKNKAELFLDCFADNALMPLTLADREREAFFNLKIDSAIHDSDQNPLNNLISLSELEDSLGKISKSSAIGKDLIHNLMLKNLFTNNRRSLLFVFNLLLEISTCYSVFESRKKPKGCCLIPPNFPYLLPL